MIEPLAAQSLSSIGPALSWRNNGEKGASIDQPLLVSARVFHLEKEIVLILQASHVIDVTATVLPTPTTHPETPILNMGFFPNALS